MASELDHETGGAFYQKPRLSLCRALGFGSARARFDEDEEEGFAPGYCIVETVVVFDWKDRLRLLASGKLIVSNAVRTDRPVNKMRSIAATGVLPPSFKPRSQP